MIMSTSYRLLDKMLLEEQSSKVRFNLEAGNNLGYMQIVTDELSAKELRTVIIKQIEVLSYISEDANEVLSRFNISYGDIK